MSRRLLTVVLVVSLALNALTVGWLAWIVADPSYWFPGAYEAPEAGPPGERGPRGPAGPRGPRGFPGPPGESADQVEIEQLRSDLDDAMANLDDVTTKLDAICDEFFFQREVEPLRQIWLNAC